MKKKETKFHKNILTIQITLLINMVKSVKVKCILT